MGKPSITLSGNIGKDLESVSDKLTTFSVAVNYTGSKTVDKQNATDWYDITIWGSDNIGRMSRFKKGDSVTVVGTLSFSSYEKEGVLVRKPVVNAFHVEYAGGGMKKEDSSDTTKSTKTSKKKKAANPLLETEEAKEGDTNFDDIPF